MSAVDRITEALAASIWDTKTDHLSVTAARERAATDVLAEVRRLIRETGPDGEQAREALGLTLEESLDGCEWWCSVKDRDGALCEHNCRRFAHHGGDHQCLNGHYEAVEPGFFGPREYRVVSEWEADQ